MNKKYQIFISSTYTDLKEERIAVRDAVLMMQSFPVGMEQFTASNDAQWKIIQQSIDCSDYYVLIIGKRYGSLIEDGEFAGISYTQREFEYAQSKGVPVLVFIKDDCASYAVNSFETDPLKIQKLSDFITVAIKGREVNWFTNSHELAAKVIASLHNEMKKNDRPGWIRGDELTDDEDDSDVEIDEYEFGQYQTPTDGLHLKVNSEGTPIAEGEWRNSELVKGTEFDYLVLVTQGELIFKPNCPDDPYDSSYDFKYEKYDQYGWHTHFFPFMYSRSVIENSSLDKLFVADFEVENGYEQMVNIKTLEEFLADKDPEFLDEIRLEKSGIKET